MCSIGKVLTAHSSEPTDYLLRAPRFSFSPGRRLHSCGSVLSWLPPNRKSGVNDLDLPNTRGCAKTRSTTENC